MVTNQYFEKFSTGGHASMLCGRLYQLQNTKAKWELINIE
jgi:hypothetical protein